MGHEHGRFQSACNVFLILDRNLRQYMMKAKPLTIFSVSLYIAWRQPLASRCIDIALMFWLTILRSDYRASCKNGASYI